MAKRDYYDVLGVSKNATDDEIKKKYRSLAIKYHPDRQNGKSDKEKKEAEEKFKEATEAYEVLSNKDKRAKYDQFGFAGVGDQSNADYSNVFHDFGDIFGDFFGEENPFSSFFGRHTKRSAQASNDKNIRVQIDLEQAIFGCSADIKVVRNRYCKKCNGTGSSDGKDHTCPICNGSGMQTSGNGFFRMSQTCSRCHGTGKSFSTPCSNCNGLGYTEEKKVVTIKIPKGSVNGKSIVIPKMGDEDKNGNIGNLNISLVISESSKFKYSNGQVYCKVNIPLGNAIMGKDIYVHTHKDEKVKLSIPRGCSNGKQLLLTTINGMQINCIINVEIPITYNKTIDLTQYVKSDVWLEDF